MLLWKMKPDILAKHLVGGLTAGEMDIDFDKLKQVSLGAAALDDPGYFVLPPVPNSLFTRDSSCWMYNGVSVNPMYWPARRRESLNLLAIYRYHPMFQDADFKFWYPEQGDDGKFNAQDFGRASLEGGDVMPIGNGTVLIGMSERSQGRMIEQIAKNLFAKGAAEQVIAAVMTKDRAHMHLDTVFTFLDRDIVTAYPRVVSQIRAVQPAAGQEGRRFPCHRRARTSCRAVAGALKVKKLTVVETGGDEYQAQREQWDDANNTVALEPGVVVSYERNTYTISKMRAGRRGGHRHRRLRAGQGPRRRTLHDLPHSARCRIRATRVAQFLAERYSHP